MSSRRRRAAQARAQAVDLAPIYVALVGSALLLGASLFALAGGAEPMSGPIPGVPGDQPMSPPISPPEVPPGDLPPMDPPPEDPNQEPPQDVPPGPVPGVPPMGDPPGVLPPSRA